jgi:catalase (peroxidase I)
MAADASAASNFAALAWQCASTFRATDYAGGCNGARIRFPPQSTWPANRGLVDAAMQQLQPVKKSHSDLSWADLIVLAGTLAVEQQAAGSSRITSATVGAPFSFCPGRTDASSAAGTEQLAPRKYSSPELAFKDGAVVQGLTAREAVVLAARPRRCVVVRGCECVCVRVHVQASHS